ncbi:uncharacterized protein GLRG_05951 [Colletotrichum graminicola M1.001]|uniref:Uncharacterized protein n=1 Tax=Colletotrichum graminicola (strain M1.001 / M2 / FGSC 10212) TaxID=645133 RepID=E3QIW9_COLGM|nr:uncharacterized protein GLRG_05951 [Colletotrichum graminicola M1.001]EFQ30807.1 hypothetical protein GLRG_05951 [Colletotrichum graminicola M1.001]
MAAFGVGGLGVNQAILIEGAWRTTTGDTTCHNTTPFHGQRGSRLVQASPCLGRRLSAGPLFALAPKSR